MKLIVVCLFSVLTPSLAFAQGFNPPVDRRTNIDGYPTSQYPTSKSPSASRASIEKALSSRESRLWREYASGKTGAIKELIRDDAKVSVSNGAMNKKEWIAQVESGACKIKSFRLEDFVLKVQGPRTAEIRYRAEQDAVCNGKPLPRTENVLASYIKIPDKWQDGRWWEGEWQSTSHQETTEAR